MSAQRDLFMNSDLAKRHCRNLIIKEHGDPSEQAIQTKMERYWVHLKRTDRLNGTWNSLLESLVSKSEEKVGTSSMNAPSNPVRGSRRIANAPVSPADPAITTGSSRPPDAVAPSQPAHNVPSRRCSNTGCKLQPHDYCYQCRHLLCPDCLRHHLRLNQTHASIPIAYYEMVQNADASTTVNRDSQSSSENQNSTAAVKPISPNEMSTTSNRSTGCSLPSSSQPSSSNTASSTSNNPPKKSEEIEASCRYDENCKLLGKEACIECCKVICDECFRHHDRLKPSHHRMAALNFQLMLQVTSNNSAPKSPVQSASTTTGSSSTRLALPPRLLSPPGGCRSPDHPLKDIIKVVSPPDARVLHQANSRSDSSGFQGNFNASTSTFKSCEQCSWNAPQRGCGHCGIALCLRCTTLHTNQFPTHSYCELSVFGSLRDTLGQRPYLSSSEITCAKFSCEDCVGEALFVCARCFTVYCESCSSAHAESYQSNVHDQWYLSNIPNDVAKVLGSLAKARSKDRASNTSARSSTTALRHYQNDRRASRSHKKPIDESNWTNSFVTN
jgi:hypothetical protein